MNQTPETGPAKTPSVIDALPGFCDEARRRQAERGAAPRAVPLGNTGTTVVEGARSYIKRDVIGAWSRVEVSL